MIVGLAAVLTVVSVPSAAAATSATSTPQTILAPRPEEGTKPEQNVVRVGTVSLAMSSTQTAYVVSVMRFNSATGRALADNEVVCTWPGGSKNMVIGQNVLQRNTGHSLGYDDEYYNLASGSIRFADQSVDNDTTGQPIQASVDRNTYFDLPDDPILRIPATNTFDVAPGFTGLSVFGDSNYVVLKPCEACTTGASTATFTLYVPLNKLFEIRTDAGCIPRFNAYVRVDYVSQYSGGTHGTAAGLTDSRGSTSKHDSDMSHIYAVPYV